jgi:hypothetical protein
MIGKVIYCRRTDRLLAPLFGTASPAGLRHLCLYIVEGRLCLPTENEDDGDDHARNGGDNQTVFDGGSALFILQQIHHVLEHLSSPSGGTVVQSRVERPSLGARCHAEH